MLWVIFFGLEFFVGCLQGEFLLVFFFGDLGVGVGCLVFVGVYVEYVVVVEYVVCGMGCVCSEVLVDWGEIWLGGIEQLFEVFDYEVGLLVGVDVVVCVYYVFQVEVDVVGCC